LLLLGIDVVLLILKSTLFVLQHLVRENQPTFVFHSFLSGSQFLNGKANRMSKAQFEKMKINLEEYQKKKYPELKASIVYTNREKGKKVSKKNDRQTKRNDLMKILEKAYGGSHSIHEFETHLKNLGHSSYYRANELAGVMYNGEMKFRLSKLGFDSEKMQQLTEKENEFERQLAELDDIRNGTKERGKEKDERERLDDDELIDSFDEEEELVEENEQ
jgi:hypothetical protein